jgi:hypothetical protein
MSVTANALIDLARYRIPGGIDEPKIQTYRFQVGSWIPTAMHRLCERICKDGSNEKIGLITVDYTSPALSSGVADLSSATYSNILFEFIGSHGIVIHSSTTTPLQHVATEQELRLKRPFESMFIHYTVNSKKIKTKNTDGSLTSLSGTLAVTAPSVPTIQASGSDWNIDLHDNLIDDAVDILQEIFTGKMDVGVVLQEGTKV